MNDLVCEYEQVGITAVCKHCQKVRTRWVGKAEDIVGSCRPGSSKPRKPPPPPPKCYRERTSEELSEVIQTCLICEHRTEAGLCGLLIREGCGACRSMSEFSRFRRSGRPCPDKPPRFPATLLTDQSEPAKEQSE